MLSENSGIYRCLCSRWVLITTPPRNSSSSPEKLKTGQKLLSPKAAPLHTVGLLWLPQCRRRGVAVRTYVRACVHGPGHVDKADFPTVEWG